ncbi:MAG: hypothetical protein EOO05_04980 [Chitinophagaceae bacterium]|nr:MAG: hypothetical protein EOO05_04980 [Chitinophagaceae bacterium]
MTLPKTGKKLLTCTLFAIPLFSQFAHAQKFKISDALGKAKEVVGKVGPEPWKPGSAITTSIKDTLYGFSWIDHDYLQTADADSISSFDLKPGYYKARIRSYCLHAGVYGPSKGDGYQIAKLKGMKAAVVRNILEKSALHPEIAQQDVQKLIWGIEAGTKFSSYQPSFQLAIKPLLTEAEIAAMQVDFGKAAGKAVPAELRETMATYASLRDKMQSSQAKYDEIEAIAVKTGVPPLGLGSKVINAGVWSYIGDGFYLKATPESYPRTEIELYRPAKIDVTKDSKNRVSTYSYEGRSVTIVYNDAAGADMLHVDGRKIPVWKIKSFKLKGNEAGQVLEVPVNDWLFRGNMAEFTSLISNAPVAKGQQGHGPSSPEELLASYGLPGDPVWQDVKQRYDRTKKWLDRYEEYKGYVDEYEDMKNPPKLDDYIEEAAVNESIYEALKAALNPLDKKGQMTWIRKNLRMTLDMMFYSICQLRGGCNDNDPRKPDLPSNPAQPGNTSRQRIGLSPYKAN